MIESLITIFCVLLIYYVYFLLNVHRGLKKVLSQRNFNNSQPNVSILIAFRNEEKNILNNLNCIKNLDYPYDKLEIIYLDDYSTDKTVEIIKENNNTNNIKVISNTLPESGMAHKKNALLTGIKNAVGEIIMITDADCVVKPAWVMSMLKCFNGNTSLVSGPVVFTKNKNLFEKFQKLEFAGLNITGAGLIGAGKPIISSSANLAFRKNVFESVGGYDGLMNLTSGDDDLLMQKIKNQTEHEIKYCWNHEAIVKTEQASTLSEFINQRRRWASKGLFYKDKTIVVRLIGIFLFYIGLLIQLLLGIFSHEMFYYSFVVSFISKVIFEYIVLSKGKRFFFAADELYLLPVFELLQIPYIIIASILGAFGNFEWKGREVKR